MSNITEFKTERERKIAEYISIQEKQLSEWEHVLNDETMELLREFCKRVNAKVIANENVRFDEIPRGVDLSSTVQNYAMHKAGVGGYGLERAIQYKTYHM